MSRSWSFSIRCLSEMMLLLVISTFAANHKMDRNFSSHKTNGISKIPWNILLDPNYTSHKMTPFSNHSSNTPTRYSSPSSVYEKNQQSYDYVKDSTIPGPFYVPSPVSQVSKIHGQPKYPNSFTPQEQLLKIMPNNHFSTPIMKNRAPESVLFPTNSKFQYHRPETPNYNSQPPQKNKISTQDLKEGETKKQKRRKPFDYEDLEDDDYMDSYYQDYDYAMDNERPSYKPPMRSHTSHSSKYKPGVDPFGLLPSASDPEGFFAKAKDILRGGSYNRPSYASGPEYYSSYQPNKLYGEPSTYGAPQYYDQENTGYPSKGEYYGNTGYDYDTTYGDKYGGFIPYPEKKKGSKYGPLAFALGLLPLGLLIASLVPTVVTIPVTTAVATGRRRKRSVHFVNPVLDTISEYGLPALEDPECLNRIFCQVVRAGGQERSSIVQKFYYKLAYILDEKIADAVGLKSLLIAVRKDHCQQFQCITKTQAMKSSDTTLDSRNEESKGLNPMLTD